MPVRGWGDTNAGRLHRNNIHLACTVQATVAGLDDSIAMGTIATRMLDKVGIPAFEVSDLDQRIQTFCIEKGPARAVFVHACEPTNVVRAA
jgi:hypothetical protein